VSIEIIQKVTQAEQDAQTRKQEAAALARKLTAEAEQQGAEQLEQARREAESAAKEFLAEAEGKAARREQELMEETDKACEELRRSVAAKLPAAAELIVRRVVGD